MTRAGSFLLVALALCMLGFRFAQQDLAAFARDEPQFLAAAREQLRTGQWLQANPLFGNMGMRYGPTAFWFYGLVQLLFGDAPRTGILAMGLVLTTAHLAFAAAVTRLFRERLVFFAVILAFMASSPYQFHWSRLAWDLTSNAGVFAAAAILCAAREVRAGAAAALGLVLGLAVSTHPSVTPFVFAVAIVLAAEVIGGRLSRRAAATLAATALAVNVPYLLYLVGRARILQRAPRQPFSWADTGRLVLEPLRLSTPWRLDYFFDASWGDFLGWLSPVEAAGFQALTVVSLLACALAAVAGIVIACRSADAHQQRLGRIAALTWVAIVTLLAAIRLEIHPHYQFAAAWVPIFGVASLLAWLRGHHPRAAALACALFVALAAGQFVVIVQWMRYVEARDGTRGPAYGTPLGSEIATMRIICGQAEREIRVWNDTTMFRFPFEYLATTEEACRGKQVQLCGPPAALRGHECSPSPPGVADLHLRYAGPQGGALRVER